ncbi:MAG TPA: flagellar hook-basal body complex protein FliE, partial [Acetobacteraceae bacterium]|nr:flagellar hook-basal body complex protein FliE [Acetobacteraceae bacterium]
GFGAALSGAIGNVLQTGQQADQLATAALTGSGISGQADLTNIVTSVSKAQLALQTSVAIRDRMVQAYQTIMNMPM